MLTLGRINLGPVATKVAGSEDRLAAAEAVSVGFTTDNLRGSRDSREGNREKSEDGEECDKETLHGG
jgi:hypothetical protein